MKFPSLSAALMLAACLAVPSGLFSQTLPPAASAPAPAPAPASGIGPRMTFDSSNYNFGKVNMGTQVYHTYIVTNTGDQPLVITSVSPGCHCTTAGAALPMKIAPGQTGQIPIKFDSGGLHGDVTRTVTVTSNGKPVPIQTLYLHGTVWQELQVTPMNAYMTVLPDSDTPATATVRIVNQGAAPIILSDVSSPKHLFKAEVKTNVPGREFELVVTAQPPFVSGNNNIDTITVKTTSTNVPFLNITAIAMVQQAIGVAPMQIVLPPTVLGWTTNMITISANGRKTLALSDLQVCCDPSIKAELKEIIPGRVFHLSVAVPAGFSLAANQRAQVSVKSNSPERPLIVVPITQYQPRPGMTPPRPRAISQGAPPSPPAPAHP